MHPTIARFAPLQRLQRLRKPLARTCIATFGITIAVGAIASLLALAANFVGSMPDSLHGLTIPAGLHLDPPAATPPAARPGLDDFAGAITTAAASLATLSEVLAGVAVLVALVARILRQSVLAVMCVAVACVLASLPMMLASVGTSPAAALSTPGPAAPPATVRTLAERVAATGFAREPSGLYVLAQQAWLDAKAAGKPPVIDGAALARIAAARDLKPFRPEVLYVLERAAFGRPVSRPALDLVASRAARSQAYRRDAQGVARFLLPALACLWLVLFIGTRFAVGRTRRLLASLRQLPPHQRLLLRATHGLVVDRFA